MKKNYLLLFLVALVGFNSQAQQVQEFQLTQGESGSHEKCGSNHIHERLMQTDAEYVQKRNMIEQHYQNYLHNEAVNKTTYTIPVVVHIIHTGQAVGTGANISDAQIQSAINNLNAAYSNTNTAFSTYTGVNTNIQFCLAQRDASGNPTTGIVRVDGSSVTQYSSKGVCDAGGGTGTDNEVAVKALSKWDNTKYYNFWIVTEINDNGGGSGTQGYAYFPGAGSSVDGAIMLYNSFGYDPDGSLAYNLKSYTNRNVTAVHEVGHALNLYHTFQGDGTGSTCPSDAVCGTSGDCVSDTPPHKRSSSNCLINTNDATCGNVDRDLYVHNFMDYSSDVCQTEFTAGQSTRMQAVMTGSRSSLNASDGCNPVYTRDAGVSAIITPNVGTCGTTFTPEVTVKNYGSGTLTSFTVTCNIDGGTNETYNWTGSLVSGATVNITMPSMTTTAGAHTFNSSTSVPNGLADQYASNDTESYAFTVIGTPPTSASCSPTTTNTGNYQTGINRVQFNTLDHAHADGFNDGLQDFSCQYNTTVTTNTAYTLTVTLDVNSDEYCLAWIDYNDNGIFETSEKVLNNNTGGTAATSHSVSVTIPQYPDVTGKLIRMRIMSDFNTMTADGCTDTDYGEIEDYSIFITTPPCSAPVLNSSPVNAGGCEGGNASFTCSVTGPSLSYQWQVSSDGGSSFTNVSNGGIYTTATTATLNLTGINSSYNSYLYKCYISNPCGNVTSTAATLSSLATATASCSPTTTNPGNFQTGIIRFQFNTIDKVHNNSNNDGTQNFVCTNYTTVNAGSTHAFTISGYASSGSGNNEYGRIYIDYNDNGTFEVGEIVYQNNSSRLATHTGNITIPTSSVTAGKMIRMRVITDFSSISGGCNNLSHGEIEDYGIYIPCITPTVSSVSSGGNCNTGTVDLGATPSGGTIKWYDASSGGTLLGTGTSFTTPSISSTTTYYAEALDVTCISATRTAVEAVIGNCTKTYLGLCGTRYENIGTAVVAYSVPGATMYKFEVVNGGTTQYIERTDRWFYFTQLGSWAYNTDYTIRVAARVGGVYTAFGDACIISTPYERKIYNTLCGTTLSNINNAITAYTVPGAVKYKFEVVNGGTTQYIERTDRWFYFTQLGSYLFDTPYTIRVASSTDGTTFSAYGPACVVTTPSEKRIYANLCGATLASMGSAVSAYSVGGAVKYKFKVVNGGNTQYIERTSRWFYFTQLGSYAYNTAYDVSVATSSDGTNFSTYGPVCVITTPVSAIAPENDNEITLFDSEFSLEAYPNPSDGDFTISSTHEGIFNIVNELGQLIQKIEITKENNYQTKVEGLDKGVYFVTGVIDGNVVTKKVMVL